MGAALAVVSGSIDIPDCSASGFGKYFQEMSYG